MSQETLKSDLDALKSQGKLPASSADISALATVHSVGISDVSAAVETVLTSHFDKQAQSYLVRSGLDPITELNNHIQRQNRQAAEDERRAEATRQWYERHWSPEDYKKYVEKKGNE